MKKIGYMKWIGMAVLIAGIALFFARVQTRAGDTIVDSGTDGTISWELTSDGVLTVSGSGAIEEERWYCDDRIVTLIIEEGITAVDAYAFAECGQLSVVSLPDGLLSLGEAAFGSCTSLTSIELPESLSNTGWYSFSGCTSLKYVTLNEGIEKIYWSSFKNCTALESIVIPESVTAVEHNAFCGCSSLSSIYFKGDAPVFGTIAGWTSEEDGIDDAFEGVTATCYYPAENSSWTSEVMQDHGGTITWVAYDPSTLDDEEDTGTDVEEETTTEAEEETTIEAEEETTVDTSGSDYEEEETTASGSASQDGTLVVESGFSAYSEVHTLEGNFDVTYTFHNVSNGEYNWDNFILEMNNGNGVYIDVRADNYGWLAFQTDEATLKFGDGADDWDAWNAAMREGLDCTVNVVRSGNTFTITTIMGDYTFTATTTATDFDGMVTNIYLTGEQCTLSDIVFTVNSGDTVSDTGEDETGTSTDGTESGTLVIEEIFSSASEVHTLEGDFDVTYTFHNVSNGSHNWENFILEMNNGAGVYLDVRADNYGWTANTSDDATFTFGNGADDWTEWFAVMSSGVDCTVNVVRSGNTFTITTTMGNYTFTACTTVTDFEDTITNIYLTGDHCTLTNIVFTINPAEVYTISETLSEAIAEAVEEISAGARTVQEIVFNEEDYTGEVTVAADETATGNKVLLLQMSSDDSESSELSLTDASMIDEDGNVVFAVTGSASGVLVYGINGDATGDNEVDASDTLAILRGVSGRTEMSVVQEGFADVNLDNKMDSSDLLKVVKYVSGRSDTLN